MVTWKDVLAELKSRPTVSVPTAGRALGDLIPSPIDQNRCAHWRNPMDMMRQG